MDCLHTQNIHFKSDIYFLCHCDIYLMCRRDHTWTTDSYSYYWSSSAKLLSFLKFALNSVLNFLCLVTVSQILKCLGKHSLHPISRDCVGNPWSLHKVPCKDFENYHLHWPLIWIWRDVVMYSYNFPLYLG